MAKLNINGKTLDVNAEPDTPLLWAIREQLGLTGTKYGCGVAQCGACTVYVDGEPVRSCSLPISAINATQKIITIEGASGKIVEAVPADPKNIEWNCCTCFSKEEKASFTEKAKLGNP